MNDGAKQVDFLGQEEMILGHNVTNYGTNEVTFGDRSWCRVIMRQIMGQHEVTFGTGEVNITS